MMNSANKYTGPIIAWPDPNTLMQLCEKQGIQAINIPNYNQNNSILTVQANSLPMRIIPNMYLPSTSQPENVKHELEVRTEGEMKTSTMQDSQAQLQQQSAMAEYFQKLQATTLPLTLQQLIKFQTEQTKKDKTEEEKVEHTQNNILNIPSVPVFRNTQLQNGNTFMNSDQMMTTINPNDLNVHIENQQENDNTTVQSIKVEQQLQTDSPKTEKKMKFRAKTGEIKISVALDGSTLYCCPECNLAFPDKTEIEQHIQAHIQERKYQCKECGAMLKRKEHLDQHMRGHSDERPFKCPVCQKAFKRNEHLTRHYVIHSGDKNFTCSVCQKAFSRKDHLNKHTQTHLGIRRNRIKKESFFMEQKDSFEKTSEVSALPKQEVNFVLKDGFVKQEPNFLQYIQNLQKDQNLIHTFSSFKEQAMKEANILQQQAVNMNEILPQNTRYLMPS
ncbi:zinc finger protein with KRAB and SCAN domains 5-like isoform X2 [Hylaeus anthracinus]|uniref:zinc finger protein with KRAB and SCAN domains 5-like isoform X2 n=1 Tax=Hylaeus volcanicus TaxID=313075 RepID=UPI0023B86D30|nr:zinc finger protein with KRAB and SCAN domains 5-like isoform X2 [Hylaeus volcanicus]XP_054015979.1 zinc finger protein with KRAB and SCAN domains 5-like isoform X2 [Hylaeus anthracinus]